MPDFLKDQHPVTPPEHPAPKEAISTAAKPVESQLDRLKKRRREARENREPLDLPIPGYGDELVARYRVLDYDELRKLETRGAKMAQAGDTEAGLKVTMDTIAQACVGIFLRQDDGSIKALNECVSEFGDEPIRYDERLAETVGVDAEGKVRVVIRRVFPTDLAILGHLAQISNWMEGVNDTDDQDF
jgi:hypothetical protein